MRGATWWQNLLGEFILAALLMATVGGCGLLFNEPVPVWAYFIAAYPGIVRWHAVTYKDLERR